MKIVYFNYLYDLYGISIGSTIKAVELMRSVEELGHEVKIYWRKSQPKAKGVNGSVINQSKVKKFIARFLHDPKQLFSNFKYIIEEMRILRREKPDLLISRLDLYLFSSLLVAKMMKIPIIIEADAPNVYEARTFQKDYMGIPGLAEYIESKNLQWSNAAICVSNAAKNYFLTERNAPTSLEVISNGVDTVKFSPNSNKNLRSSLGLDNNMVVGFVGSFHYWHGIDNLFEIVQKSVKENSSIRFLFVGHGGPMQETLQDMLDADYLTGYVNFTGSVKHNEIPGYINSMDIVLAPYPELEFFYYSPVKVYEYMACGKPVITTKIGQLEELIENGVNGYLAKAGDITYVVETIINLSQDKVKRSEIGKNASEYIASNHTWKQKAERLEKICLDVISQK